MGEGTITGKRSILLLALTPPDPDQTPDPVMVSFVSVPKTEFTGIFFL